MICQKAANLFNISFDPLQGRDPFEFVFANPHEQSVRIGVRGWAGEHPKQDNDGRELVHVPDYLFGEVISQSRM